MISKKELQALLDQSLDSGADFGEIFLENTYTNTIRVMKSDVTNVSTNNTYGAGVRLLQGTNEVYGYTNDVTYDAILKIILQLKATFKGSKTEKVAKLGNKKPFKDTIVRKHADVSMQEKSDKLLHLSKIIQNYDERITQTIVQLQETKQSILVANTKGIYQDDDRTYTRVVLNAVASENGQMQDAFEGPGRFMGFEIFDHIDFDALALEVAKSAILLLHAENIQPQVMPVVLHNGFGGVIFHEACGHPLEASAVSKGLSPFSNKLGEVIGSELVTAYDDGSVEGAWGSLHFDDEGYPTQKNLLIEKGVLKGYLVDIKNGRRMQHASTGSSRRQSYKFPPTSRMNSTYIDNGTENYLDIIKDTPYGLFAKRLGGGTVNPATGEFNFAVMEGYMIEKGELTKAVKGAMLVGHGKDILFKIDRIANNLEFGQGMCGAASGSIPVDVGQPTLRVSEMTVGGQGGNN